MQGMLHRGGRGGAPPRGICEARPSGRRPGR